MLIREVFCKPVGPLERPVLFRPERPCTVIFDENEAGKTAFVDVLVNLLFRKGSARSRFRSRRFSGYEGYVRIEHGGAEISLRGDADLDMLLGFPPQFSRLPIVRGSDLAFLWSGERERNAPLVDACLRYFAADMQENLETVVKNIRAEAGLPARKNAWSQEMLSGLEGYLQLYRHREVYLKELEEKERLRRALQEVEGRLVAVRDGLNRTRESLRQLEEERMAALCAAGKKLERRLSELQRRYRDAGYERCSREDALRWAEIDARLSALREKRLELQREIGEYEAGLRETREKLDALRVGCREAEEACRAARSALDRMTEEANRRGRLLSNALGELRNAAGTLEASRARRERARRLLLAVPVLAAAAVWLCFAGMFVPAGFTAAAGLGSLLWGSAVASACKGAERDAADRVFRLIKDFGVQPPARAEAAVSAFERYCLEEDARLGREVAGAERIWREAEAYCRQLLAEETALLRRSEVLEEGRQRSRSMLRACEGELAVVEQQLQELQLRTGKPGREELEETLREKATLEEEMTRIKAELEYYLGPGESRYEKLAGLEKYLELYPNPRSPEDLDGLRRDGEQAERKLREDEAELRAERYALQQRILEASRRLVAAGCEDVGALAGRLAVAEEVLKAAIRKTLAALWAQRVIEAARGGMEDALLEPLGRASELFRRITGRYDSISYTRRDGDLRFEVRGRERVCGEEVLSDGTRAQFLLAMRLALLERFLAGEKGFLVLDDPLLGSSEARKRRAVEVLLEYAGGGWQVVYLTVDAAVPEIFRELGGNLVALKRVGDLYRVPGTPE